MLDGIDISKRDLTLPALVCRCEACQGRGVHRQRYLEGTFDGPCDFCGRMGFRYIDAPYGSPPIGASVLNQIGTANGLTWKHFGMYGTEWQEGGRRG